MEGYELVKLFREAEREGRSGVVLKLPWRNVRRKNFIRLFGKDGGPMVRIISDTDGALMVDVPVKELNEWWRKQSEEESRRFRRMSEKS